MTARSMKVLYRLALALMMVACRGKAVAGAEVPFELGGGVILVKASVNGMAPRPFIFDTGATESLLTPWAADKAGAGRAEGQRVTCDVALAGQSVSKVTFLVHDPVQAISLRLDNGIDYAGILGYPLLSTFLFSIDYGRKRIDWRAFPSEGTRDPVAAGTIRVPFTLRDRLIHVPVTVNGKGPITFLVDTGSAEVLLLPHAVETLGLRPLPSNRADGIRFAKVDQIAVGSARVSDVSVVVHRLQREGSGVLTYDGILGYPFLSHFRVTFDYRDKMLTLEPLTADR